MKPVRMRAADELQTIADHFLNAGTTGAQALHRIIIELLEALDHRFTVAEHLAAGCADFTDALEG